MTIDTADQEIPHLHAVHLNLTSGCNLGCSFCYAKAVRGRADVLPIEIIVDLVKDCTELSAKRIILSGGEPMLRKDWQRIANIVDMAGIEVSIATNGTLITRQAAEFLASLKQVLISISIDGGEVAHDTVRGQRGAYQRTVQGIQFLRDVGVEFDVNATLLQFNLSEIASLTKFSRDFGCSMRLTMIHPNGRGEDMGDQMLTLDQILRIREYCHIMRQSGLRIYLNLPPILQYLEEIIPNQGAACGWGVNFCGVLANGDVTICGVASNEPMLVAGNLKRQSFKEIWNQAKLFEYTRSFSVKDLKGICG